mmetsp:Transcript_17689/g.39904  ORF Transcript_17689/g.39904 Transcript_17689/m.39904 type:complete len:222 (-) Transcript_17689:44-709(-)
MNGKVVEPYYYTSSFGLVASVINAMITYIGHITNGEYISLKLTATKDGEKTRVYCNAAHVVFDVYGSGPRQNGEGGTIDHSLTGRRQHNVPNRLQRIHVQHNCAGGCARGLGRESRRNTILANEATVPPISEVCWRCTSDTDANERVRCSTCPRSFCHGCHIPTIPGNLQGEPEGWSCAYCIVVGGARGHATATAREIEAAIANTRTMDDGPPGGLDDDDF